MNTSKRTRRTAIACALITLLLEAARGEAELKPGDTLNQTRWQEARGMMPDPILHHFATGQHVSKLIELPPDAMRWSIRYNQATEENQGKYEINEHGIMSEKATGTWPRFGYGTPFAQIDPSDPKAPYKIMWLR